MKNFQVRLFIGIFTLLLSFCFIASPVSTQAAGASNEQEQSNMELWMDICKTMGSNLHKKRFVYGNNRTASSYSKALSSGRKRANCALYVSWCLQQYGALKKGQTFYTTGSGRVHKNFRKWGKKVKVIRVNKRCSSVKLQKGDIVCWSSHVNIYAGLSKSGKRLWFDGGKISTYGGRSGSRYKSFNTKELSYLNKRKISYIIRIKNL